MAPCKIDITSDGPPCIDIYRGRGASIWVGGQKFDKILNLPHYAWITDKIVRPKELLIPPKNSPLYLKLWTKIYKYMLTKNSKIQMRKFHLSKKRGAKAPPAPRRRDRWFKEWNEWNKTNNGGKHRRSCGRPIGYSLIFYTGEGPMSGFFLTLSCWVTVLTNPKYWVSKCSDPEYCHIF